MNSVSEKLAEASNLLRRWEEPDAVLGIWYFLAVELFGAKVSSDWICSLIGLRLRSVFRVWRSVTPGLVARYFLKWAVDTPMHRL